MSSMRQLIPLAFQVSSNVAPDLSAKVACELFLRPRRLPWTPKETELLKEAQSETLQSGRKVYFWGADKTAPVVAFIHGWESRGTALHKWIPLLNEAGFRVMGWDGPAHGDSPGNRTTGVAMAKAFAADLNELSIPLYGLIGHSLGGVVTGLLSREITLPPKVVILSAPSRLTEVSDRYNDQIRLSKKARRHFQRIVEEAAGLSFEDASLINNNVSEKTDTLVIHDIDDREVPFSDFKELQSAWKNARFVATQGLGHRRIIRDLTVGHQIIDFFKSQDISKAGND